MILGIREETWVDIFTAVSALSAAFFGMLALFTDFKKDGRITRYGRMAVIGIALSATISIGLTLLKSRIDLRKSADAENKARAQRADEATRFKAQEDALKSLAGQMGTALTQLRSQNVLQKNLVAKTQDLFRTTQALSAKQDSSTLQVLRRMWQDTNLVTPQALAAVVQISCEFDGGGDSGSEADAESWSMATELTARRSVVRMIGAGWTANLRYTTAAGHRASTGGFAVSASDPRDYPEFENPADPTQSVSFAFGGATMGEQLEEMAAIESWAGRDVLLTLSGPAPGLARRWATVAKAPVPGDVAANEIPALERLDEPLGGRTAIAIPQCTANMAVTLHSRLIAEGTGSIFEVTPGLFTHGELGAMSDEQRKDSEKAFPGYVMIVFEPAKVRAEAIPRFAASR